MTNDSYFSNGKLLFTGEYLVTIGAKALALPTKQGQRMQVSPLIENGKMQWTSFDNENRIWLNAVIDLYKMNIVETTNPEASQTLLKMLQIQEVHQKLKSIDSGFAIRCHLDFNKDWGLGTSSTFVNNFAQWLDLNPYTIQEEIFKGSGYDIACAQHQNPIFYQLAEGGRIVESTELQKEVIKHLYFIYLGKKQNSRDALKKFDARKVSREQIEEISSISVSITETKEMEEFQRLVQQHNSILSFILQEPSAQDLFSDCPATIKNLGAWGGDFIMAVSKENPTNYFQQKGLPQVFPYSYFF